MTVRCAAEVRASDLHCKLLSKHLLLFVVRYHLTVTTKTQTNEVMSESSGVAQVEKNGSGDSSSTSLGSTDVTSDLAESVPDLRYGCCFARPSWLQWLNNIVGAVTFISLANCMQSVANGLYGVVLSTIERQFDLTSSQSSWIAVGYEIGGMPILILLSVLGTR